MQIKSNIKHYIKYTITEIYKNRLAYLCLLPFVLIFFAFTVLPVIISMFYGFTYFNVLQKPIFIGFQNYINLFTTDEIFIKTVTNTLLFAAITGPGGYIASLLFAWIINELSPKMRSVMVLVFYAPSISGSVYLIWKVFFSGDELGYLNSFLINLNFINEPIQWLTDKNYMKFVVIVVTLWMSLGAGFLAFIAGLQTIDKGLYEAGWIDGIKNRWQELWFITLPSMKPQLLFGAVMAITSSFAISEPIINMIGFPTTDDEATTVIMHLMDYGTTRFDMGYACAITTMLFLTMLYINKIVRKLLGKLGT